MAVFQELRQPVLSLPWGNDTLPLEVLPFLEQFDHIVLWFGNDITGFNAARQLSKKLGYERCSLFRPLTPVPTPMDALRQGKSLSRILKFATRAGHQFIQHFKDLRFEVQSELSLVEQVKGIQFKRFPLLNKLLKGHRRGELTIVTGPTGSGKTTFISELSLDLCIQGVNTLWGSFEIKNVRLMKTMLIQFARKNLATHFAEFDKYADQFEQLPMHFMAFHGQESLKRVIDTMDHAVYVHDISHIIVDNLQFMMGMGQLGDRNRNFDRLTQQDEVVAAFRQFATSKNCHVTLVIHPRKEPNGEALHIGSIFGSAKASQEADNILLLQLVENMKVTTQPKKYIQVAKNRFDGDLGSMLLKFDKDSLSFGSKPSTSKPSTEENIQETIQPNNQLHSEHSEEASDEEL
ncbi:twinkle protein, mitochondrial-like [Lingula anatina]|uniref:DNA 5'-3' helicase n=1 Tax=Lingula anatina TaxID=7574 RepID=A0A1S3HR27_LINAN|nr:twinkle protein, mitochondrial-like [Lingula anatina]|eukprot:XP_013387499.1 twinkle protein, mitochondrial-like [Lingula anatina]